MGTQWYVISTAAVRVSTDVTQEGATLRSHQAENNTGRAGARGEAPGRPTYRGGRTAGVPRLVGELLFA